MTKRAQLGMAMFLISAAVFFLLLIIASAYFRAIPHVTFPAWVLAVVVAASGRCIWNTWRWAGIVLGAFFLIAQGVLYGIAVSVLIAIHALFVVAGLISAAVVPTSALKVVALYLYFFAAVWAVIFVAANQL
jgi:hypothetical protein